MIPDDWNQSDELDLGLFSPVNPFDRGHEGLDAVLDVVESAGDELCPGTISFDKGKRKYSRQLLHKRFDELQSDNGEYTSVMFRCARIPDAFFYISGYKGGEGSRFSFNLHLKPFSWCSEPRKREARTIQLLDLVRTLANHLPLTYGYVHSNTDRLLDTDLNEPGPSVPAQIERVHWLNVYGPRFVEALGRERVLSTPAWRVEELPHGAVLILTRPTPVDFASEEARLAQARALVHLNPGTSLDTTLAQLRQRSLAFTPLDLQFHPDVKEILQQELDFQGLLLQRPLVERFNLYRPPAVSEWVPITQQPWPDMPDLRAAIADYEAHHVRYLLNMMHKKVPSVLEFSPESLPALDWYAWHMRWFQDLPDSTHPRLILALGAYLGALLVRQLGGQWVPRQEPDEAAVVVGDRAWRPFLRARHGMKDRQAALDFSLTQFFREARRARLALTSS